MNTSRKVEHLTVIDGGSDTPVLSKFRSSSLSFKDGGGDAPVDAETKNYVDANVRAMNAENSASFAKLEAKIDGIQPGATWLQITFSIVSVVVVGFGLVLGILAYASDRFDSGVSAMGAIEEALDAQRETNASQDARLEKILEALETQQGGSNNQGALGK